MKLFVFIRYRVAMMLCVAQTQLRRNRLSLVYRILPKPLIRFKCARTLMEWGLTGSLLYPASAQLPQKRRSDDSIDGWSIILNSPLIETYEHQSLSFSLMPLRVFYPYRYIFYVTAMLLRYHRSHFSRSITVCILAFEKPIQLNEGKFWYFKFLIIFTMIQNTKIVSVIKLFIRIKHMILTYYIFWTTFPRPSLKICN